MRNTIGVILKLISFALSCDNNWMEFNGLCYHFGSNANRNSAKSACMSYGGHLACIHDYETNNFIADRIERTGSPNAR